MPVRPLNPAAITPATAAMFDLMADGAWHDNDALIAAGATVCATDERSEALKVGQRVRRKAIAKGVEIDEDTLISSGAKDIARNRLMIAVRSGRIERNANQHRMLADTVAEWTALRPALAATKPTRARRPRPVAATKVESAPTPVAAPVETATIPVADDAKSRPTRAPNVFGGIPEEEGFARTPITAGDRVHFRTDRELPLTAFRKDLPTGVTVSFDEGEGLYRVDGALGQGDALADFIKAWAEMYGYKTIGLRAESAVKRRAPRDLPDGFLADLCNHYGRFSLKRLQRNMSTIRLHIPDSDDINQQVYEWILKAVAQYDETKGVPFGAFLATQLSKWVHDLNRNAYGRTAADAENKQQKAIATFIAEHQRRPSEKELAAHMGISVQVLRKNSQTVATLDGLRNMRSLDVPTGEDGAEIPLPASHQAPDDIEADTESSLLSQALTAACAADPDAPGRTAKTPNVIGWATWYATTWGGKTKTELAADLETSMRNMNVYTDRAQDKMAAALSDLTRG